MNTFIYDFFFFFWVKYTYSFRLRHCSDALAYCSVLCLLYMNFSQISLRFELQQISHSAQTAHIFPSTASSLHSGDGKAQLSTFKQTRGNASRGIYMMHELPQSSTNDCGSWFGFIHHIKYSHILYKAYIEQ